MRPCQEYLRLEISTETRAARSNPIVLLGWYQYLKLNLLARSRCQVSSVANDTTGHRKASSNGTRATTLHYERTEAEHQKHPASSYTAYLPLLFSCYPIPLDWSRTELKIPSVGPSHQSLAIGTLVPSYRPTHWLREMNHADGKPHMAMLRVSFGICQLYRRFGQYQNGYHVSNPTSL